MQRTGTNILQTPVQNLDLAAPRIAGLELLLLTNQKTPRWQYFFFPSVKAGVVAKDVGSSRLRLLRDASSAPEGWELLETGGVCGHSVDLEPLAPALGFLWHSTREKQSMPH